ncbi:MAG: hypothetical protein EB829_02995 [Nitrosopumilus sp. H8]|nr:MAG: hypothetical protein EB829_02995 [Nitrosopumilus sp. H8]
MNMLIPGLAAVAAIAVAGLVIFAQFGEEPPAKPYANDFTFSDIIVIKEGLTAYNLSLSVPTPITDSTIDQYCTYFDADGKQHYVSYCTTTALVESGATVGNINIGGTVDGGPVLAVALVESASLDPGRAEGVFEVMARTLVCDCWADVRPGGFASIQEWMDEVRMQFAASDQSLPLKSRISGLDQKDLVLEIRLTDNLYLWALVVTK